ncbi:MAG: LPS export ABC transporter periplasmic protein LptC [Desulfoarculaceae bacterium]|nr:LPS export ABC transporter periplasmic protein LptC [Desulfoarculaceae bacterium]
MRIHGRNFIWLIPLALLLTFPLWRQPLAAFLSPRGGYDPSLALNRQESQDFTMNRVRITQSHNGQKTLDLTAVRALTGKTSDEFEMEDVNATITSKEGEQTHVTAREGLFDKGSSLLILKDDVVIKKPGDNYEIYTELLHYNDKTKIANCPGPTRLIGETVSIKGGSLEYNLLSNSYDIGGRVYCTLTDFVRP